MKFEKNIYSLPIFNFPEKIIIMFILMFASGLAISSNFTVLEFLGIMGLGLMYCHAQILQHDCLHDTAFKSKKLNYCVGVLLGLPMLVSFSHYRVSHRRHHAHIGTSRDQEFFGYHSLGKILAGKFFLDLFGFSRIKSCLKKLTAAAFCNAADPRLFSSRAKSECCLMIFLLSAGVLLSLAFQTPIILKFWIIPLLFVAEPAYFLIELPEHFLCDKTTQDYYRNTRDIKGSWFSFWLTNGNNFHVEHHQNSRLQTQDFPGEFLQTTKSKYHYFENSYPEFYFKVLRSLILLPARSTKIQEINI